MFDVGEHIDIVHLFGAAYVIVDHDFIVEEVDAVYECFYEALAEFFVEEVSVAEGFQVSFDLGDGYSELLADTELGYFRFHGCLLLLKEGDLFVYTLNN